jgi:hypothetical protein
LSFHAKHGVEPVISNGSREYVTHHMPMHIRQPPADAIVVERQPLVIDAEQVQHGRMKIVPWDRTFFRLPADFVRGAVTRSRLEAGAGEPAREAVAIVVAAGADDDFYPATNTIRQPDGCEPR